ncbi:MAG: hypothetical protein H0U27_12790 [Nitrosopumilus sp.]|nr:hypothetical protein [Nitrosopumilus sp.]
MSEITTSIDILRNSIRHSLIKEIASAIPDYLNYTTYILAYDAHGVKSQTDDEKITEKIVETILQVDLSAAMEKTCKIHHCI